MPQIHRRRLVQLRRAPIVSVWTRNRRAGPEYENGLPPPEYQEWPALTMGVICDWSGPLPPNPPFRIGDVFNMPWRVEASDYYESFESGIYTVCVWFHLDLYTGGYLAMMELREDDFVHSDVRSEVGVIPVDTKIDLTITYWIGALFEHEIEVTFRT